MRREFHPILLDHMRKDPRIVLCTGDLGFKMWDNVAAEFPDRYHNVGAAEQLLLGVGVGLALSGKIPVCFSITPFLIWRPAEWTRNFLNHEGIAVKLLAGGRGLDYREDGFTHDATDDWDILENLPRIKTYHPHSVHELPMVTHDWLYNGRPSYLNLKR